MIHGDPSKTGISIQISSMTVPEEEDAVRNAMKLQEEDAGPVIVPQSVDAVPKPAGST